MFKDANVLDDEGTLDVEMLENYIVERLNGVIGEEYAEVKPNITFTDGVVSDNSDDNDEPLPPQAVDFSYVAMWGPLAIFSLSVIIAFRFRHGKKEQ